MNQYKLLTVLGTCLLAAFLSQCALEEKKEEEATATTSSTGYDYGHLIGSYKVPSGAAEDLVFSGNYAYVAAKTGGLHVINITSGSYVHNIPRGSGETWDVTLYGSYLFIANRAGGVPVYDISGVNDSSAPALVTTITPGFNVDSVAVNADGTRLAVGGASGKIRLYDISDKASPSALGNNPTHTLSTGKNVASIAIKGNTIFAGDADGKLIPIDVSTVGSPSQGTIYESTAIPGKNAWGLGITLSKDKDHLYYSNWGAGFIILDIAAPATPKEIGRFVLGDGVYDSFVDGNRAYLANSFGGVGVVDISDPGNINLVGSRVIVNYVNDGGINKKLNPHGIWYHNQRVYVADNSAQTMSIIITDETSLANESPPATVEQGGSVTDKGTYSYGEVVDYILTGTASDVAVSGNYAYLAAKAYGVHVIDISNKENPVLKKTINTNGSAWNLEINGSNLFIADRDNGVVVINVSDPPNASILTTINLNINVIDLTINSNTLYAVGGDGTNGFLKIANISDLNNVATTGSYQVTGTSKAGSSVGFHNNHVFYGAADGRLYALNVSNPASISESSNYYNAGPAGHEPWGLGVTIDGGNNRLYYSDWGVGLVSVDISNTASISGSNT
ncbi:MAG: hypothetical protein KDK41_16635, partial [Leptospiraceae bacterium]|nr:hypothetical protein [Leptospiraceae bacterium]